MENKRSQNKYAAAFTIICLIVGFAVGYSLFKDTGVVIQNVSPLAGVTGVRDIIKTVTELCSGMMIQFALVFASGYTLFSYPICGAVLLYRGAACGYAVAMTSAGGLSSGALPQTVSYVVVTMIISVLAFAALDMSGRIKKAPAEKEPLFPRAVSLVYLMLLTSGAAVFMKVLPLVIFTR